MRTKVELLQLLLDNIELIGKNGLCLAIWRLHHTLKLITLNEQFELEKIINKNPTKSYLETWDVYYFPAGEKEPRIKYLKQLIKYYQIIENYHENGQTTDPISFG